MSVSFSLPKAIEDSLRAQFEDLDSVAREAALVELYRQGRLTHHELELALELERFEVDALLKRHNVTEDLTTPAEHHDQIAGLRRLLGE